MMGNNIKSSDDPQYRQVTGIIVGCGNRGQNYAEYARLFTWTFSFNCDSWFSISYSSEITKNVFSWW